MMIRIVSCFALNGRGESSNFSKRGMLPMEWQGCSSFQYRDCLEPLRGVVVSIHRDVPTLFELLFCGTGKLLFLQDKIEKIEKWITILKTV